MRLPAFVCLSVCEQDYSKTCAWIWMKCCVSTDVGTWTNWLTFEPDPDYSPDAETGLLSPMSEFYYGGKIPRIAIGRLSLQRRVFLNGIIHREPSEQLCRRHMRSTECPSSLTVSLSPIFSLLSGFQLRFYHFYLPRHEVCVADNVLMSGTVHGARYLSVICLHGVADMKIFIHHIIVIADMSCFALPCYYIIYTYFTTAWRHALRYA